MWRTAEPRANPAGVTAVPRSFLALARASYDAVAPLARRWLPAPVKRRLYGLVGPIETALRSAPPAPDLLRATAPLLAAESFAQGPIVLVNNGLAWGGAERQLVNTVRGLEARRSRPVYVRCEKLGEHPDYDFYRPALDGAAADVANMMALSEAEALLRERFAADALSEAQRAIAWLPTDVRERIWRLMGEFAALRPRVVHGWQDAPSIEAGFAARLVGAPRVVLSARNLSPPNFAHHRPHMRPAYLQLAACDDVVFLNNSEAGARDYARWLGMAPGRIQVLRNGFDAATLRISDGAAFRQALGIPAEAPLVGSIFRFYDEKRPALWVETASAIARRAPLAHFAVCGAGPLLGDARARAARLGFADRFHTPGPVHDVAEALSAFDLLLLTSKHEGTPNVILEAGAMGVPAVTTPAGGAAETVLDGVTGRIVDTHDPEELARAAAAILNDAAFRVRCAAEAPAFVERRFGLSRMIDETLALYRLD